MSIVFFEKKSGRAIEKRKHAVNCAVTKCGRDEDGSSRYSFRIIMRAEDAARITKTNYCAIGYDADTERLYFKESDSNGYKLCNRNTTSCTLRIQVHDTDAFSAFRGSIALLYDDVNMMYYIQGKQRE